MKIIKPELSQLTAEHIVLSDSKYPCAYKGKMGVWLKLCLQMSNFTTFLSRGVERHDRIARKLATRGG